MTRTIVHNTGDGDTKANAAALLQSARDLDVPASRVKTVSPGERIDFSAPTDVFLGAGLDGGDGPETDDAPDDTDDPETGGDIGSY